MPGDPLERGEDIKVIEDVADEETSHRETCDDPDCLICSTP
jgi:hypothetical protein